MYQPKTGSWGAFPRPKDISKTYGGGRRIGPGFSDEEARSKSAEDTRERLKRYREKMGIDVKSEKEYAAEIDEALNIASLAMQRGIYSTAVSALEKVTKWCSSNSKVGGKVFLELAMAYEAAGRTNEAITVYKTLSTCRMEDIKFNAKRLLYSLEAMEFMQKEVRSSEFARKQAKNTFIETTGLDNFASNFDDVYQTAYVDLEGNFFKKLTQSVVRTTREARQILLRATNSGEVDRTRIIQALRVFSRYFDEALQKEIERNTVYEPVAIMNGKPIIANKPPEKEEVESTSDGFKLMDPAQMMDRLNGEWRLQLLANKRGDGVKFFNNTLSFQKMSTDSMTFSAVVPLGFVSVEQSGKIAFNEKRRILRRQSVQVLGGGVLAAIFKGTTTGAPAAVRLPQQVVMVDSVIMVTRGVPSMRVKSNDAEKDYFAVWRKVENESTEL
jgi:tetratricopeptide (TPR) repeat protein